jgi:prepilin-type N-terminal cleavage/methylation domain-containing protein
MMAHLNILNLKHLFQNRKAFTLIEFILGLTLLSIVLTTFFSIINFSRRALESVEFEDELLLNGRFGIEYLKEEIKSMDKVIDSNKISQLNTKYPNNIGFVLMSDNEVVNSDDRYKFVTYYLNGDRELVRIAKHSYFNTYPMAKDFSGYNVICKNVFSIKDTIVDKENKLIKLSLNMGKDSGILKLKSTFFVGIKYDF